MVKIPIIFLVFVFSSVCAQSFLNNPSERFEYAIWWGKPISGLTPQKIIKAGYGYMETRTVEHNGEKRIIIKSQAKSTGIVNLFYYVDNRGKIIANSHFLPLTSSHKYEQGSYFSEAQTVFDWQNCSVSYLWQYRKNIEAFYKKDSLPLSCDVETFDVMSAFYKIRSLSLRPPDTLAIKIFDIEHGIIDIPIVVLKKEKIETVLGKETSCIVIQPLLKSEHAGFFIKKGSVFIWLTDDEKRIPVRLETSISIGKVIAELSKVE